MKVDVVVEQTIPYGGVKGEEGRGRGGGREGGRRRGPPDKILSKMWLVP